MSTVGRTRGLAHATPRVDHFVLPIGRLRGRLRSREQLVVAEVLAEERRRMAADVHDLIMQDLSFALASARALADDPSCASQASIVVAAGERALAGARDVVGGLVSPDRKPVVETVEAAVRKAARSLPLTFDAEGVSASMQPDQLTLDTLVHVGREAVTNAVKHADPLLVEVHLTHADEWRLQVCDNGHGFDPADSAGGFGLESMREQAEALGGSLQISSTSGAAGTTVEAVLP
jgi:signal transduction histidine kinase